MKKWTNKTKKTVALGLVAITLVGGGSAYAYTSSQSKQQLEAAQTEVKKQETTLKALNKELEGYFDKKSPSYLVENMKASQITDLKKEVKEATTLKETTLKVDRSTLNEEVATVNGTMTRLETTFNQQQAVNKLFTGTAVNGSKISKDLVISDDLKMDTVENVKSMLGLTAGSTNQEEYTPFDNEIIDLARKAESQLKQIDTATQAVKKVFSENKIVSIDTKLYDTAKTEVDKIKNAKAKKALTDQLSKVKADMDKKIAEETKGQAETKQESGTPQQQVKTPEAQETAQAPTQTDQGQATPDYTGTDAGGYVPQGGGYEQPQNQAPIPEPQAPATGGGQTTPPVNNGGGNSQPNYPSEGDFGEIEIPGGGTGTGGWEEVK